MILPIDITIDGLILDLSCRTFIIWDLCLRILCRLWN